MLSFIIASLVSISSAEFVRADYVNVDAGTSYVQQIADRGLIYDLESSWRSQAEQPIAQRLKKHTPKVILIHHTGEHQNNKPIKTKLKNLYRFSIVDKKWGDVPYHFYIDKNGNMMGGRPVEFQPDTNTEFNPEGYLNVVIEGNYTANGGDRLNAAQSQTLKTLVAELKAKYKIKTVKRHNDVAQTECPGSISIKGL